MQKRYTVQDGQIMDGGKPLAGGVEAAALLLNSLSEQLAALQEQLQVHARAEERARTMDRRRRAT